MRQQLGSKLWTSIAWGNLSATSAVNTALQTFTISLAYWKCGKPAFSIGWGSLSTQKLDITRSCHFYFWHFQSLKYHHKNKKMIFYNIGSWTRSMNDRVSNSMIRARKVRKIIRDAQNWARAPFSTKSRAEPFCRFSCEQEIKKIRAWAQFKETCSNCNSTLDLLNL